MRQLKTFMKLAAWMLVVQRWQRSGPLSRKAPAPLTRTRSESDFKAVNSRELVCTNNKICVPALHIFKESKYVQEVITILCVGEEIRQLLERWKKEKSPYMKKGEMIVGKAAMIRKIRNLGPFWKMTKERQPIGKLTLPEFPATLLLSINVVSFHLAILYLSV